MITEIVTIGAIRGICVATPWPAKAKCQPEIDKQLAIFEVKEEKVVIVASRTRIIYTDIFHGGNKEITEYNLLNDRQVNAPS